MKRIKIIFLAMFFVFLFTLIINANEKSTYINNYYKNTVVNEGIFLSGLEKDYDEYIYNNLAEYYSLDKTKNIYYRYLGMGIAGAIILPLGVLSGIASGLVAAISFLIAIFTQGTNTATIFSTIMIVFIAMCPVFLCLGLLIGLPLMIAGFIKAKDFKKKSKLSFDNNPDRDEIFRYSLAIKL